MELKKSRLIALAVLIAVLVLYLFAARIFIPGILQNEVAKFSEERGVDLTVGSASFGLARTTSTRSTARFANTWTRTSRLEQRLTSVAA